MSDYISLMEYIIPSESRKQIDRLLYALHKSIDNRMAKQIIVRYMVSYSLITDQMFHLILSQMPVNEISDLVRKYNCTFHEKKLDNIIELLSLDGIQRRQLVDLAFLFLGLELRDSQPELTDLHQTIYPASLAKNLLPHQENIFKQSKDYIFAGKSFLIQMPTGSGKTITAAHIIARTNLISGLIAEKKCILWIAPSVELLDQAYISLSSTWARYGDGAITTSIGIDYNIEKGEYPPDILFLSMQLLTSRLDSLLSTQISIGLVVVDEAHRIIATTYHKSLLEIHDKYAPIFLGLSATPGRNIKNVKENQHLARFFGKNLITFSNMHELNSDIEYLRNENILSKANFHQIQTNLFKDFYMKPKDSEATFKMLSNNYQRNLIILEHILKHVQDGKIIVFSCSLEHSRLLVSLLTIYGISAHAVDSTFSNDSRKQVLIDFRDGKVNVLINFNLLTTGFDVPKANVIMITRPTTSIIAFSQMIGRGLRGKKVGGTQESTIYNCQDWEFSDDENSMYNYFADYWTSSS